MNPCCTHAVVTACASKDARIRELETSNEPEDVQVARAERDEAIEALRGVLAILKRDGGFRTPRQQATMRAARALLVEHGVVA